MRTDRVEVPAKVLEGIEAVRRSGKTNMLDVRVVKKLAGTMGYRDAADWIEDHAALYALGVLRGFTPDKDGDS